MSDQSLSPPRAAALAGLKPLTGLSISIEEVRGLGMISLRGSGSKSFAGKVKAATGLALPKIRKFTTHEDRRLLWMSPDEWLIFCAHDEARSLCAALETGLQRQHVAITDVSDARVIFRLKGDGAREVIMKGSPVDMHPDQFKPGDVRRTQFNEIPAAHVMIADAPPVFLLIAFRSYAAHIHGYLGACARAEAMVKMF